MNTKKKKIIIVGGIAAVFLAAGIFLWHMLTKEETYRLIQVVEVAGEVEMDRENIGKSQLREETKLQNGDKVSVKKEAYTRMALDEDKYVYAEENTEFALEAEGDSVDSRTKIHLSQGAITTEIQKPLTNHSSFEVTTPNSTMSVRGTVYRVSLDYDENGESYTKLEVFEGEVASKLVRPDGTVSDKEIMVGAGKGILAHGDAKESEYILADGTKVKESQIGETEANEDLLFDVDLTTLPEQALQSLLTISENEEKELVYSTTELEQALEAAEERSAAEKAEEKAAEETNVANQEDRADAEKQAEDPDDKETDRQRESYPMANTDPVTGEASDGTETDTADPPPTYDPDPDADPTPDFDSDETPDGAGDGTGDPNAEPSPDPLPTPDVPPDMELTPMPEPTPDPRPDLPPDPLPTPPSIPDTELTPDPEPVPMPDPDPAPVPTPDPDPQPAPDPQPEPDPDPTPDPQPEPDPDPAPDPEPDPDPQPEPDPDPAPDPEPEAEKVSYRMVHKFENPQGTAYVYESNPSYTTSYEGVPGEYTIAPQPLSELPEGYYYDAGRSETTPEVIAKDGTTVLELCYTLRRYTVTWVNDNKTGAAAVGHQTTNEYRHGEQLGNLGKIEDAKTDAAANGFIEGCRSVWLAEELWTPDKREYTADDTVTGDMTLQETVLIPYTIELYYMEVSDVNGEVKVLYNKRNETLRGMAPTGEYTLRESELAERPDAEYFTPETTDMFGDPREWTKVLSPVRQTVYKIYCSRAVIHIRYHYLDGTIKNSMSVFFYNMPIMDAPGNTPGYPDSKWYLKTPDGQKGEAVIFGTTLAGGVKEGDQYFMDIWEYEE